MVKSTQSLILFTLGFLVGIVFYWLASVSFLSRSENSANASRVIASYNNVGDNLKNCSQIKNITNKENIDIYCSFVTKKMDHKVSYKVRSTITVKKNKNSTEAVISVKNNIKDQKNHIPEADYCTDCTTDTTVDLKNLNELNEVSQALMNQISNVLHKEHDHIEEAVEEAYDLHKEKVNLKKSIANCEISKNSTVDNIQKIEAEEKIECRRDQIANIEDSKERTKFFQTKVKKDLWYLASQDEPLEKSFFFSDYMRDLKSPDFFNHDYFAVRSAIDTIEKYNDLRLFMHDLGDHKLSALNNIATQLPFYFYTNDKNPSGRQDRISLEAAWNRNFKERPFPTYYSLSSQPPKRPNRNNSNKIGMSALQFRTIVNSPEFQKLYRQ